MASIWAKVLPEKAAHYVLEKACGLLLHKLRDHVAQNSTDGVEPLVSGTDVIQAMIVEQDLLHNEYSDRLAEL